MATIDWDETPNVSYEVTGEIAAAKAIALTLGDNSVTRTAATGKKIVYSVKINWVEVDA